MLRRQAEFIIRKITEFESRLIPIDAQLVDTTAPARHHREPLRQTWRGFVRTYDGRIFYAHGESGRAVPKLYSVLKNGCIDKVGIDAPDMFIDVVFDIDLGIEIENWSPG